MFISAGYSSYLAWRVMASGGEHGRTADSFAIPLCLWQRAEFLCPPSSSGSSTAATSRSCSGEGGGGGGGKGERDSLRLRIAQLHHEYWRERSRGCLPLHVQRLTQSLLQRYSTVMDSSEGVDSIMAPVKVLSSNHKKESRQWKSELTVETLLAMPGVNTLDREGEREERLRLEVPPVMVADTGSTRGPQTTSHTHPHTLPPHKTNPQATSHTHPPHSTDPRQPPFSVEVSKSPQPYSHTQQRAPPVHQHQQRSVSQFSYSTSGMKGKRRGTWGGSGDREEEEGEEDEDMPTGSRWGGHGRYRGRRYAGRGLERAPRKKARRGEEEEEEEEGRHTSAPFITAQDQYVLDQQKKYGRHRAPQGPAEGSRPPPPPQTAGYGCSKKSLGTRRAPGSKFVPPVRREDREGGGGDSCLDAVRSRVHGGGPSGRAGEQGGAGAKGLPPELEGDERLRNVEPRMVELIMNEIMDHSAPVQWDDIAGLQFAKATIKEIVVWPMLRPDIFTGLRGPPKGILLFGPPGTGKTLIGKCIASQVNATFFSISASSLTSKWIGEGEKMVRALFSVARCYQPAVVFMDEIDSLLSQRSNSEHESSRRIKTEFLVQLDGATTSADDRVLIIGATNRPQEIDEAARRRLVKRLYIPLPDGTARKQIVCNLLRDQAYSLSPEELEELCTATDGYSGADMANLCREAAYGPVREAAETIQYIAADEMRPVLYKDFQAALQIIRPSVSEQDLDLYVQWNKTFGCGKR